MTDAKTPRVFEIAEPCPAAWEGMPDDGARRHCASCNKSVHDLSAMTPSAGAELLSGTAPVCVRVRVNRDGSVLHDAPSERGAQSRLRLLLRPVVLGAGLMAAACAGSSESDLLVIESPGFVESHAALPVNATATPVPAHAEPRVDESTGGGAVLNEQRHNSAAIAHPPPPRKGAPNGETRVLMGLLVPEPEQAQPRKGSRSSDFDFGI